MKFKLFLFLALSVTSLYARGGGEKEVTSSPPEQRFNAGRDYLALESKESDLDRFKLVLTPTKKPGQVEILWFFWYGCGYCREALPSLAETTKSLDTAVKIYKVPLSLGSWETEARAHAVFLQLGVDEQVSTSFYNAVQGNLGRGSSDQEIADWLKENYDIAQEESLPLFHNAETEEYLAQTKQMAETLGLTSTPSFVVARRYVGSSRIGIGNMFLLMKELVGLEQYHMNQPQEIS